RIMTGLSPHFQTISVYFHPEILMQWLPGIVFGGLLFFILRRFRHSLTVPLMLLGAIGLFYLLLPLAGESVADARTHGWLPNFPTGGSFGNLSPVSIIHLVPSRLKEMDWA